MTQSLSLETEAIQPCFHSFEIFFSTPFAALVVSSMMTSGAFLLPMLVSGDRVINSVQTRNWNMGHSKSDTLRVDREGNSLSLYFDDAAVWATEKTEGGIFLLIHSLTDVRAFALLLFSFPLLRTEVLSL